MLLSSEDLIDLLEQPTLHRGKNGFLNYKCKCPECGKPEFFISINIENHPGQCWRKDKCGYSTNIYGILKLLNKLHLFKTNQVKDIVSIVNKIKTVDNTEIDLNVTDTSLPIGYKRIFESSYLESRGFNQDSYNTYEVGMSKLAPKVKNDYLIFPVREFGNVKGYVARHYMSKKDIDYHNNQSNFKILRYRNSTSEFGKLLYGVDDILGSQCVIVVEGIFDKISVDRYLKYSGLDKIAACVCSFGSSITIEQVAKIILFGVSRVILFYDEDAINKIKQLGRKINAYFPQIIIEATVPLSNKDPGDSNFEEIEELLFSSKSLNIFQIEKIKNTLK